MAVTYKFYCLECYYEDNIYIGNTKIEFMKGVSTHILGSCLDCGQLFSNAKRNCKHCGLPESSSIDIDTFGRIKTWFFKLLSNEQIKFYQEENIKKVPCPKCSYRYLTSYPYVFND